MKCFGILTATCALILACSAPPTSTGNDAAAPDTGPDPAGDSLERAVPIDALDISNAPDSPMDIAVDASDRPVEPIDARADSLDTTDSAASPDACPGVDLQNDPSNCGACGIVCCGAWCINGVCGAEGPPGVTACPTQRAGCTGPIAVDTSTDPNNCGGCGVVCPPTNACQTGACTCPSNGLNCGGTCVDVQTDTQNCGGCGIVCPCRGQPCNHGSCVCPCAPPLTICGAECVNVGVDINHCGTCNNVCGLGEVCEQGACVSLVDAG